MSTGEEGLTSPKKGSPRAQESPRRGAWRPQERPKKGQDWPKRGSGEAQQGLPEASPEPKRPPVAKQGPHGAVWGPKTEKTIKNQCFATPFWKGMLRNRVPQSFRESCTWGTHMDVPLQARSAQSRFRDMLFENHIPKPGPHSFVPHGRVALLFARDEEQGAWREAPMHSCIYIHIERWREIVA